MAPMRETIATLENENGRLRGEVETLRFQMRAMLDVQAHYVEALLHLNEAGRCAHNIMALNVQPTTLHD